MNREVEMTIMRTAVAPVSDDNEDGDEEFYRCIRIALGREPDTVEARQAEAAIAMSTAARGGPPFSPRPADRSLGSGSPTRPGIADPSSLPYLLTAVEAAAVLRTTVKAVYTMVERRQLAGVVRRGRRLLFQRDVLLRSLRESRAPSPGGRR